MEENPRKNGTTQKKKTTTRSRVEYHEGSGDSIDCSGKHCRSCAAGIIADSVAICCCPCAVVNFVALAFCKVPWVVVRKCLGGGKRKKVERVEMDQQKGKRTESEHYHQWPRESEGNLRMNGSHDDQGTNEEEESTEQRVWLELYQVGHLGFGRVSSSDINFN